ncbi:unnamed protein product (macronuclear) [Paramecium tetraurelia]|uniref:Uncharacterized protein n=1 Tax=Paramecium tetraurelia TaxID=5888 RepID=A0DTA9_PARTE|nr:uncharacterized protein GSPATT00019969001 [Paramecium tetraurelia]CAK86276.1 unnamed protein product [Paramecium tetraurelia]|eukprot:XP_001453673.1 hypothetical protein (macronuclear) [Paramecium tetraurelia strain d4-2]
MNTSFEQINKSPLNHSVSKQLYSFPKANRFKEFKDTACPNIYTLPSMMSKRGAGIGYGQKSDLISESITPGPNNYQIRTTLNTSNGWTMPVGRDKSNKYEGIFLGLIQKTPGPGQYEFHESKSPIKYSMRMRTESHKEKDRKPGPGEYNLPEALTENGKYQISKFRDSGAIILSPPKALSSRFSPAHQRTPGPGQYQHKGDIDPQGLYYCSKFADTKSTVFTKAKRELTKIRMESPGPGAYKLPSEFGFYEKSIK